MFSLRLVAKSRKEMMLEMFDMSDKKSGPKTFKAVHSSSVPFKNMAADLMQNKTDQKFMMNF